MTPFLVAGLVGLALMVASGAIHRRAADRQLEDLLAITPFPLSTEGDEIEGLAHRAVELASQAVAKIDRRRSFRQAVERARLPLRPGELVVTVAAGALGAAAAVLATTHSPVAADSAALGVVGFAYLFVRRRITKRRRAFEAQLPDALSLVGSSLSAGHTFLRAIAMMCEESGPPLSEEFSLVLSETQLGAPLVDSLERMAGRLQIRDVDMMVQAIRIQQTVGGRLADLLHTLADFIRARGEVRREVQVLTAEGRMSAYVLTGLVPFLFLVIRVMNPDYMEPMLHGWGMGVLAFSAGSVMIGLLVILRMVKIEI